MVVPSSPKATFKIDEWGAGSPDKVPQTRLNNVQGQKQPDGAFCCSPPSLTLVLRLHFSSSQVVAHLHWLPSGRDRIDTSLHKLKLLVLFRPFFLASPPFGPISFRKTSESSLSPLDARQYLACTSPTSQKKCSLMFRLHHLPPTPAPTLIVKALQFPNLSQVTYPH
ncbi:hypothetical protein NW765_000452 [Fusarium oxysporum]|nr:hypothetical protein NW765_000452 [Fusarium oxysporum]